MNVRLIMCVFVFCVVIACKTLPEQKAKNLIAKKVVTIISNANSYQPISFGSLDSTFSDDIIFNVDSLEQPKTFRGFNMKHTFRYLRHSRQKEDTLIFYFDRNIENIQVVIRPLDKY
ncbi:MAG: hypothetical protein QM751_07125 [Paludibacteraceae bacterium]